MRRSKQLYVPRGMSVRAQSLRVLRSSQVKCYSGQVKSYSPGGREGSAQRKPQGPARWGGQLLPLGFNKAPYMSSQVKSRVTPRENVKAARSVNHRSLPGGGGLWVCMRRPQQLYGPLGMSVRARALRC
jgi:hypothetical protein